jgi:hypothetical protein
MASSVIILVQKLAQLFEAVFAGLATGAGFDGGLPKLLCRSVLTPASKLACYANQTTEPSYRLSF